jgi:hypothetical protein
LPVSSTKQLSSNRAAMECFMNISCQFKIGFLIIPVSF